MQRFLFIIIIWTSSVQAQYLNNPSFEGRPTTAVPPSEWIVYGQASSPDTQPGSWQVSKEASHGNSYISMVARGYSIIDSYLWEACFQEFRQPLLSNQTYHYSVDLAFDPHFTADTFSFNNPIQLRVYGLSATMEKELLWTSGKVAHTEWQSYFFELTPTQLTNYLLLEAYYLEMPKYNGNILIDNLQYYPEGYPEEPIFVEEDTVVQSAYYFSVNQDGQIDSINSRSVKNRRTMTFSANEITFTVWDNQSFDGDTISLFLDNKCVLEKHLLTKEKHSFTLQLDSTSANRLTLYAHNVGKIPPNTISLLVSDGATKKRLVLSSYLTSCSAVDIVIEEE